MNVDPNDSPTPEQRHEMIEIAAYYLAECRGFSSEEAESDWFAAERVIDALIAERRLDRSMERERRSVAIRNALVIQES
ncbi:hypothetical protein ThidrDRAFT_2781 [Thiorhodococcus drewsii AZ1]|uniref:DUF2934 domain-containing protein n=1 Tax=Thiorhodococcus drewsii AZ1 TaxID=765913 RepID=G2E3B8_9GAMM|nr:DUF2934 domain-containing protein [Thiorhodococcus drewsii]EGV30307.1 hypothetical protein ThidrDRAFT_2781 [Thiorhodococcus drewsii AZ1]